MKYKTVSSIILLLLLIFQIVQWGSADDINEGPPNVEAFKTIPVTGKAPVVNASAAVVMDENSGRVLYEKNAYTRMEMASTTKIMTAIVALENGNLDDEVTVSKRAAAVGGSSINLFAGEKMKLSELMYGLMLSSGNDAAIAIAEHIGGDVEHFVQMMNDKALEIGAVNTSFKSPHGLDLPDHYTTAYDLALITRYALRNPAFVKIVGTKSIHITSRSLYNTNEMLGMYPGADGVKTGYTGKAGRCLVTSATRDEWKIISVVLNCPTRSVRAQASKQILDFAFANYVPTFLLHKDQTFKYLKVVKGRKEEVAVQPVEDVVIPLTKEEQEGLKKAVVLPGELNAPVRKGIEVGEVQFTIDGKEIAHSMLKTADPVPKKNIFDYLKDIVSAWGKIMEA